jgi:hypothetical protein
MNPLSQNIFGSSAGRYKRGPIWVYQLVSTMKLSRFTGAPLSLIGPLLAAMVVVSLTGCNFTLRMPEIREFPDDFQGYAILVWAIPGYPPLPIKDGKLLESFVEARVIITSTPPHYGYAWDENYFIRPNGSRVRVAEKDFFGATGSAQGYGNSICYTVFFIRTGSGTDAASAALRDSQEKIQQLLEALPQEK